MKVIFAGTPEFARVALERLCAARFEVPLVLTQPDRPAGRGMKEQASPVKQWALAHGLAASQVLQPRSLRLDGRFADEAQAARAAMEAVQADVMVVAAYGLILPAWALQMPRLGCLNIHASLLPRWRGAAPIHRAIEAGDAQTGVTIMQMDEGLDTGGMLLTERLPIAAQDTTATLHDKLAALGGRLIVEALEIAACGGLRATPQPEEGVSYARKVEKAESAIDWALPARQIDCRFRAFNPFPCASARLGAETLKLWRSALSPLPVPAGSRPGQVLAIDGQGIHIACGADPGTGAGASAVFVSELQRAGGKRLPASDFVRGLPALQAGALLD